MGTHRKDYILLILCLIFMAGCSRLVEDSRAMTPPVNVLEEPTREIINQIKDAKALVYNDYANKIIAETAAEEIADEITNGVPGSNPIVNSEEVSISEIITQENIPTIYPDPVLIPLGTYTITAYEWTGNPCANGNYPTEWYTVASNYFDFGTELYIDGVGYVVVEDRGASYHGDYWLDLYLGDVATCYEWGVQNREVYLVG